MKKILQLLLVVACSTVGALAHAGDRLIDPDSGLEVDLEAFRARICVLLPADARDTQRCPEAAQVAPGEFPEQAVAVATVMDEQAPVVVSLISIDYDGDRPPRRKKTIDNFVQGIKSGLAEQSGNTSRLSYELVRAPTDGFRVDIISEVASDDPQGAQIFYVYPLEDKAVMVMFATSKAALPTVKPRVDMVMAAASIPNANHDPRFGSDGIDAFQLGTLIGKLSFYGIAAIFGVILFVRHRNKRAAAQAQAGALHAWQGGAPQNDAARQWADYRSGGG